MLARNTVVSVGVFVFGLALLWLLVEQFGVPAVAAAGLALFVLNAVLNFRSL